MDCYEKNLEALKSSNLNIADEILRTGAIGADYIKVLKSPLGHNVLFVKNSEGNFIQMNSMYDPYEEAKEICGEIKADYARRLVVVIGVGMGYHLREICNRINEKSVIFVIERDINILRNLLEYEDFSKEIESGKFVFFTGDVDEIRKKLRSIISSTTFNLKDIHIIMLPVVEVEYIRFCREIGQLIEKIRLNHIFNMGNDHQDTLAGIRNNYANMHELLWNCGIDEFLELYNGEYRDKPAIVVASGPSLNKNMHLLKDIQDKALILACDGALKPLLEHGIEPHAVMSVERILLTYEWFYKDKKIPENTVLVAPVIVRPEIFDCFDDSRKIVTLKKSEGVHEWLATKIKGKGTIPTGSSVAHLCFSFADKLGADPIIFVGQDLAYSPEGYSHGTGVEGGKRVDLNRNGNVYVKDYNGNNIPSTTTWKSFLIQLEAYISGSKAKCIDATEGGAYKEGTEIMKLEEVIARYCKDEIVPLYKIVEKYRSDKSKVIENYKSLIRLTEREIKWFGLLIKRAGKARKMVDDIIKNYQFYSRTDEGLDRIFEVVMYIENKLAKKLTRRYLYLMIFQTPLRDIAYEVSDLGKRVEGKITADILIENVKIQEKLLKIIEFAGESTKTTFEEVLEIARADLERLAAKV